MPVIEDLDKIQEYLTKNVSAMSGKMDLEKFVLKDFAIKAGAK